MANDDAGREPCRGPDLEAIRAGDIGAFQALVDLHREPLLRVADRILIDPQLAEDAVQETFLIVFRQLGAFRGESSLGSWVMRIAINESLRLRARRPPMSDLPAAFPSTEEETLEQDEALRALDAAVDRLPLKQRLVFCLVQVEGMSRAEAASALDLAEGTVRFHLHAARTCLADRLRDFLPERPREERPHGDRHAGESSIAKGTSRP